MTKKQRRQQIANAVRKINSFAALQKALVNSRMRSFELRTLISDHKRLCRGTYSH